MTLSDDQLDRYRRDGFVVLEALVDGEACDALVARAEDLVAAFEPEAMPSVFSTRRQDHTTDAYFLESGDKIRFFFEEEAFDAAGCLRQPKAHSINKIGHALHDLDPTFERFSRQLLFSTIVRRLGLAQPLLVQSMYIFKQPRIGGEVVWHQDAAFLYTEPPSVIGLWFALEDVTQENACLWALPGGHRLGLKSRFVRFPDNRVEMVSLDATPWPEAGFVPLEVPKGTLVLLDGLLPHGSKPNRSDRSRHAYTLHVIDGACAYSAENWLQRGAETPLRGFD